MSDIAETVRIPAAHPSLPGHFPGNPVVPGVVLLDRVAAAIERDGAARLARIGAVKFLAPLKPDEDATLRIVRDGARVRFRIERGATPIVAGEGELA
ncbi:MAG TPA: hydroxymyristoyl-ACP dehydratase [Rhodanobacteraceae bacterium]|nr:hydroxymyristoyl-ACP dehydratase [Rhodanobacteraceae bacterium]